MPFRIATLVVVLAMSAVAVAAPALGARRCSVAKDFDVYAIPSGYEDGTKDVFARGVPRSAEHIEVRFVRAADGRPVKAKAFPLQTWSSRIKGFRGDGTLWLQIKLAGYGYGMPVATVSHWRAIVSYDC
jgi:hypothetical protein